jgi:nucleoside-diphosphate-sugar epimerase
MKVLLLGANGYMGPHVVRRLAGRHRLRITDIRPAPEDIRQAFPDQDYRDVDITSREQVLAAAEGMDAIINLAVVRQDPVLAFRVNTLGCLHVMEAAAHWGIRRVINTGPHFTVAGPTYEFFDFGIPPDVPPHPGVGLYPLTKSLGEEICRIYSQHYDIYVITLLFYILREPDELRRAVGGIPFIVSWRDCAEAFRLALEIDLERLPSRCEVFFIHGKVPQGKFRVDKAERILGFQPQDDVSILWRRAD